MIKNQKKAYLYAGLAVMFWGTIGSAFKLSLRYLSFIELLLYSSLVSVMVLFLVLVVQKKMVLIRNSSWRDVGHSAVLGLLNPFLYYFVLLQAYDVLLAQEAAALNYIWPVVLTLLSIPLLKQKISWISMAAILISFMGTIIIATKGEPDSLKFENPLGVGLALGSAVFWSLFWIYNVRDHRDEVIKLFYNMAFGCLYTLIAALILGKLQTPHVLGLAGSVYIGIFEMGITFVFWLKALKLSETTAKVTNLIFIAPFLSLIIISFVVGERIMGSTFIGLIFIMSGIAMQNLIANKKK